MFSFCLKYVENIKSISPKTSKTINGGKVILSKCDLCKTKKGRFIQKQKAKGLLSNLGIKTLLSKILVLRDTLF